MSITTGATAALRMRVLVRHLRGSTVLAERNEGEGAITVGLVNTLVSDAVAGSSVVPTLARYHYLAAGTGSTAEADTQTSLVAEVGSRVSMTLSNAQTANGTNHEAILQYLGTWTAAAPNVIAEIGLFDASSSGAMGDRKLVGPYTLLAGDQISITYQLLTPSGN